jgi:tetratricopeptide (TPR) repeat protein
VLLDQIPSPQKDRDVLDWHRAAAAALAGEYAFAELIAHLRRAGELFPQEPAILFSLGCLHESLAAPRVQDVRATLTLPPNTQVAIASPGPNLRRAALYFERVLDRSPEAFEARVRLAAVRLRLGRARDAAEALRASDAGVADLWVRYHGFMFLGRAEERTGASDRARAAYRQAAALYPRAQSPQLAVLSLDSREGRAESIDEFRKVLQVADESTDRTDPWTEYHRCEGRRADALFQDLHQRFFQQPSS